VEEIEEIENLGFEERRPGDEPAFLPSAKRRRLVAEEEETKGEAPDDVGYTESTGEVGADTTIEAVGAEESTETVGDVAVEERPQLRPRSQRTKKPTSRFVYFMNSVRTKKSGIPIPRSIKEAMTGPNRQQWEVAVSDEYKALRANQTWEIVTLPPGRKALGCHWVFDIKYKADGSVERFKARLVVQGNTQQYGVDYQDIFSPVARYESLRLLLAISTVMDFYIHQMDVSTAFLNGLLDIEIYMRQPPGFGDGIADRVCKLRKSLYGLKQAPRIWYGVLNEFLTEISFFFMVQKGVLFVP
jgi:hypothetical protein